MHACFVAYSACFSHLLLKCLSLYIKMLIITLRAKDSTSLCVALILLLTRRTHRTQKFAAGALPRYPNARKMYVSRLAANSSKTNTDIQIYILSVKTTFDN